MKERRRREGDRVSRCHIFEKEMVEWIEILVHLENDGLWRFRFEQLVQDRLLDVAPGTG